MLNLRFILNDLDPTGKLVQHFHDTKIFYFKDIYYWISDCENIENVIREAKLLFKILKQSGCLIPIAESKRSGCKKSDKFTELLKEMMHDIDEQ